MLSADELDLIEAWFAAPAVNERAAPGYGPGQGQGHQGQGQPQPGPATQQQAAPAPGANSELRADRWWSLDEGRRQQQAPDQNMGGEEFPRIIRTRLRG